MKVFVFAFFITLVNSACLNAQTEDFASIDFRKADSIAQLYPSHSLRDLKILSEKLTTPLSTEEEKFRAIYKWVCNNVDNDYTLFQRNKYKREKLKDREELRQWNKKFSAVVFKALLTEHKTVCTGYAYLLKELAHHAGLSCEIVHGYGRTAQANIGGPGIPNHSWNVIRLRDKWYLCDATWSSGAIDMEKRTFIKKYNDGYFLADPLLFVRNHYPLDTTWMLLNRKPTLTEFLNRPLIYGALFQYQIGELLPETFNVIASKGETVSFQFAKRNSPPVERVELRIKGAQEYSANPKLHQDSNNWYHIDYTFTRKGTHVVHVLLNDSYVFSYQVKVQ